MTVTVDRELLRNRIMQAICEGEASPEVEDAVNTCYQYIYGVVDRMLEDAALQPASPDLINQQNSVAGVITHKEICEKQNASRANYIRPPADAQPRPVPEV